jgi:hypothetical protein
MTQSGTSGALAAASAGSGSTACTSSEKPASSTATQRHHPARKPRKASIGRVGGWDRTEILILLVASLLTYQVRQYAASRPLP